eukprot:13283239-Alexandrium_andersonii.AAC.1
MAGSSGPDAMSALVWRWVFSRWPSSERGVVSATRPMSAHLARPAIPGQRSASRNRWAGPP